jgi:hypothetical protein
MDNKVTLKLSQLLALTNPPEDITSVSGYRQFILQTLSHEAPKRGPGRPKKQKTSHPMFSEEQLNQIDNYLKEFFTEQGRMYVGLAGYHPDKHVHLKDGQVVKFEMYENNDPFVDGQLNITFPPGIE